MRISRSRHVCPSCSSLLPRAASRCPWCAASVIVRAAPSGRRVLYARPSMSGGRGVGAATVSTADLPGGGASAVCRPPFRGRGQEHDAGRPGGRRAGASGRALSDLISAEDILLNLQADNKHAAMEGIAHRLAARVGANPCAVLRALLRREDLGSTCIGDRVAIPHARISGAARPAATLARLLRPVHLGAPDDDPVDLLLAVVWPEADARGFVPALARIGWLLQHTDLAWNLRIAADAEEARGVLLSFEERWLG